jgi:hypothetical protein
MVARTEPPTNPSVFRRRFVRGIVQFNDRIPDRLDDIGVGYALATLAFVSVTNPGGHALADRLLFAIANGCLAYAIVWAVRR